MTRVLVSGATGKLGAPICAAISAADDLVLAGRVARSLKGDAGFATLYVAIAATEADVVVECAPAEFLGDIVTPFLKKQKRVIVLSVGAILFRQDLLDVAKQTGGVIMVPTGALIGLDAMLGAAEGKIHSVRMVTRKPPKGLEGAPHLIENNISVQGLTEPLKVFTGNAKEAAKGFPANLNVVVALALAGNGPENTLLEIWADPTVVRNTHTITVDSDSAKFSMTMENIPSENPKTGRIVAQSVVAMLRKMTSHFQVGT